MFSRFISKSAIQYAITASLLGLLMACGGGGGGPTSNLPTSVTISGSVIDGPVSGASITVRDAYGLVIETTISDEAANYTADIPADATFPLTIIAKNGTNMVTGTSPDFEMVSLVASSSEKYANINPFSTLIVKTAQAMPDGLNPTNIDLATQIVLKHANFGLDTYLVPNPITTTINEQNVATIVKSSEAVAEMLRRTRRTLQTSGNTVSEDDLMDSLASDLTDGIIDGAGQAGTDTLIAATMNVVSGQVLIETLNNNLNVNGAPATTLMNNAIRMVIPEATDTTRDTKITREILDQAKITVNSARIMDPAAPLTDITSALDGMSPETTSEEIESLLLPAGSSADFDEAVIIVAYANDTEQEELNTATRTQVETTQPPVVSLTANQTSVEDTNGRVTLAWATSNATACVASGPVNWNSNGATSGKEIAGPLNTDATFTLICSNNTSQTTSKSVTIEVFKTTDTGSESNTGTAGPAGNTDGGTTPHKTFPPHHPSNPTDNTDGGANGGGSTSAPDDASSGTNNQLVSLNWNPNPGSIVGYIVYFGPMSNAVTTELLDIPITSAIFDPLAPYMEFEAQNDLGMLPGDNVCFTVSAYNIDGVSSPSPAVCSII